MKITQSFGNLIDNMQLQWAWTGHPAQLYCSTCNIEDRPHCLGLQRLTAATQAQFSPKSGIIFSFVLTSK